MTQDPAILVGPAPVSVWQVQIRTSGRTAVLYLLTEPAPTYEEILAAWRSFSSPTRDPRRLREIGWIGTPTPEYGVIATLLPLPIIVVTRSQPE